MYTKISLQWSKLTKPVCLTNVTCAFVEINGQNLVETIVSFIHWIDLFLDCICVCIHVLQWSGKATVYVYAPHVISLASETSVGNKGRE